MKKNKTSTSDVKSLIINASIHEKLKNFCANKNMKIGSIVEDLIKCYLINHKQIQKMIDNYKEKNK